MGTVTVAIKLKPVLATNTAKIFSVTVLPTRDSVGVLGNTGEHQWRPDIFSKLVAEIEICRELVPSLMVYEVPSRRLSDYYKTSR